MSHLSQQGVILIMVLLIVALVAGLGIKFASDYQLGLARAEARWHGAQARAYLFSGEGAAIKFLASDDPAVDHPLDLWAGENTVELEDNAGRLLIVVKDANSKFNLNNLVGALDPAKSSQDSTRYTANQRMFIRLLQALPNTEEVNRPLIASTEEATGILEAIVDWMDQDNDPAGSKGAENDYYLSLADSYRAANQLFRSVEELQMVRGVTPAVMRALRPYITVLMPAEPINMNTMDVFLYRAINTATELSPITQEQATSLSQGHPSGATYFSSTAELDTAWTKLNTGTSGKVDSEILTVKTNYFWLTTTVEVGDQRRVGCSLLQRGAPQFKVVRREDVCDFR
jgi:general secretion pathway protein K